MADFRLYVGKTSDPSDPGLSYCAVMNLVVPEFIGAGYHICIDNFYTSPKLFSDLAAMKFGRNRKGVLLARELTPGSRHVAQCIESGRTPVFKVD